MIGDGDVGNGVSGGQGQAQPLLYCADDNIVGAGLVPAHDPNPARSRWSVFFVRDDPEHLSSWCLDIEEGSIRVNHSL